jgi:hypothetical protein
MAGYFTIALLACFVGVLPVWPYSRKWGDGPALVIGAIILVFLYSLMFGNWEDD